MIPCPIIRVDRYSYFRSPANHALKRALGALKSNRKAPLTRRRPFSWWLVLIPIAVPGLCFLGAAAFPSYVPEFAVLGALLTIILIGMLVWRNLRLKDTETHCYRLIAMQIFGVAGLLLAFRFWTQAIEIPAITIAAVLILLHLLTWSIPEMGISAMDKYYPELWHPRSRRMRVFVRLMLIVGSLGGGGGAVVGMQLSRIFGNRIWIVLAVLTTTLLLSFNLFVSAGLRWQRLGKPIPPLLPDE